MKQLKIAGDTYLRIIHAQSTTLFLKNISLKYIEVYRSVQSGCFGAKQTNKQTRNWL